MSRRGQRIVCPACRVVFAITITYGRPSSGLPAPCDPCSSRERSVAILNALHTQHSFLRVQITRRNTVTPKATCRRLSSSREAAAGRYLLLPTLRRPQDRQALQRPQNSHHVRLRMELCRAATLLLLVACSSSSSWTYAHAAASTASETTAALDAAGQQAAAFLAQQKVLPRALYGI